jgi:hypothetical protein
MRPAEEVENATARNEAGRKERRRTQRKANKIEMQRCAGKRNRKGVAKEIENATIRNNAEDVAGKRNAMKAKRR